MGACCTPQPQIIVVNSGNPGSDAELAKIQEKYPNAKVKNVHASATGQKQSETPLGNGGRADVVTSSPEGCPDAAPMHSANITTNSYVPQPGHVNPYNQASAPPENKEEMREATRPKSIPDDEVRANLANNDGDSTERRLAKEFVRGAVELHNPSDSGMIMDMELVGSTLKVNGMRNLTKKKMIERAIELDASYGVPYFMFADCYDDGDQISLKAANTVLILTKQQVVGLAAHMMQNDAKSSQKKVISKEQVMAALNNHSEQSLEWQFASKLLLQAVELDKATDSDSVMDMTLTDNGTTLQVLGMRKKTKKEMIERAIELYGKFGTAFLMLADCYPDGAKITIKVKNINVTMTKQQVVGLGRSLNED